MQKLVYKNPNGVEIDLTSGNYGVIKWDGFSSVDLEIQSQQVPFQDGSVYLDSLLGERDLSVTVAVNDNNDLEKRYMLEREMITALNPKLGEGELIYTNDFLSKKINCVPHLPQFDTKNMNNSGTRKAKVDFTASNPYWEDLEETFVPFTDDHIQTIDNDGDVKSSVVLNVISNELENFSIRNVTNGEKLEFNGNVPSGFLKISSKEGNKICESQKINTELLTGMGFYNAIELNKKIYFFAGSFIYKSSDGIKFNENFKDTHGVTICCADEENNRIICVEHTSGYFKLGYYSENNEWTYFDFEETLGHIFSIASNNDVICAVGYKSEGSVTQYFILTSSDNGETWSFINTIEQWNVCKYINNVGFVVGGFNGEISTSLDGINWTSKTSLPRMIYDIVEFNGAIYVTAMGLYKSTDGMETWDSLFSGTTFGGKIASSKIFGLMICESSNIYKIKSDEVYDRIRLNYSQQTIVWINYLSEFITVGQAVLYSMGSTDFYVMWEPSAPLQMYYINGICYNGKKELAVGYKYIVTKNEDNKWTNQNINKTFNKVIFIADYNGYFAVATDGIYFSADGLDWEKKLNNGNMTDIGYLEKSKTIIVTAKTYIDALGDAYNYGVVWESQNGTNWTHWIFSNPLLGLSILDSEEILQDDNWWNAIAIGQNGQIVVRYTLSKRWEENNLDSGRTMNCACRYGNYIFTFGNDGYYAVTTDKKNVASDWTEGQVEAKNLGTNQNTIIMSNLYRIKYITSLGLYFMVGGNGFIFYSFDCVNWIILTFFVSSCNFYDFIYNEYLEEFIFVGTSNSTPIMERGEFVKIQNEINKLSDNSNLDFGLEVGTNSIQVIKSSGSGKILVRFLKKYLGV